MVKIGNRVSLFHNIGKTGTVINLKAKKITTYFTEGSAGKTWRVIVQWDDGTKTIERISDIMRID